MERFYTSLEKRLGGWNRRKFRAKIRQGNGRGVGLGLFGDISGERKEGRENGCWENDGLAGGFREKIVGGRDEGKFCYSSWLRNEIIFGD